MSKLKELAKNPGALKLIVANIISTFGSSVDNIAFSWIVYELTHDPIWISIIFAAGLLPMVCLQSIFAVWIERANKKMVMVITDFLGAVLMVGVAILYYLNMLNPVLLLVITIVNAIIETMRMPAGVAFVPRVLSEENLQVGMGINQSSCQVASIVGLAITGTFVGFFGVHCAFLLDAATFVVSLILIALIKYSEGKEENAEIETKVEKSSFWKEYKDGFKTLFEIKIIYYVCLIGIAMNAITVAISSFSAIYVGDYLNLSVDMYGFVSFIFSVGMAVGGIISGFMGKSITLKNLIVVEMVISGIVYIVFALLVFVENSIVCSAILLVLMLVFGVSVGIIGVSVSVAFTKAVPRDYLARIAGIFNSVVTAAMPITSIILSGIAIFLKVDTIFIICGIMALLFAFYIFTNKRINFDEKRKDNIEVV